MFKIVVLLKPGAQMRKLNSVLFSFSINLWNILSYVFDVCKNINIDNRNMESIHSKNKSEMKH